MTVSKNMITPLLCPPGNGVFTVNTAKERKEQLHQLLYQTTKENEIKEKWLHSIENLENAKGAILGICSDCGGGIQRGANWGPLFLRQSFYQATPSLNDVIDIGDIRVIPHLLHDKYLNEETIANCKTALYGDDKVPFSVSPLSMTEEVLKKVYEINPKIKVLSLGGDHSVSYPTTKTYLKHKKEQGIKVALIHFDAHTDLLTQRLGIDLCFGSWCPHILEDLPSADHLIQIGIRSSGQERGHWESTFGVQQIWNQEVFDQGPVKIAQKILAFLEQKEVDELYISFDIDALDISQAGATGTPETDGLSCDDCLILMELLCEKYPLTGADLMEVAPFVSTGAGLNPEPETTLLSAQSILTFFQENMWPS
jgi:agmatinase